MNMEKFVKAYNNLSKNEFIKIKIKLFWNKQTKMKAIFLLITFFIFISIAQAKSIRKRAIKSLKAQQDYDAAENIRMAQLNYELKQYEEAFKLIEMNLAYNIPLSIADMRLLKNIISDWLQAKLYELEHVSSDLVEEKGYEIIILCGNMLCLIDKSLLQSTGDEKEVMWLNVEAQMFAIAGKVSGYVEIYTDYALTLYEQAKTIADNQLMPAHPERLDLYLNYAICLHWVGRNSEARDIASLAYDEGTAFQSQVAESDYTQTKIELQKISDFIADLADEPDNISFNE